MLDTYRTLAAPSQGLYKEKGSKFLAFAYPILQVDDVKPLLEVLKKEYFDARHHCYAYVLGVDKSQYREVDDGEPSGTGGRPIHGQLLSKDVTNTLVVVVRYFGGVLLGASGLANAYKAATRDALDNATIVERTVDASYRISFGYEQVGEVMRVVKDKGLKPLNQRYGDVCTLDVSVRLSHAESLLKAIGQICQVTIAELK
ncbi:MAG: YigZ family protein [Bacteroidales bacterium]|nr:YigZ family protein [Candidatus Colimorpha onthohippi]